MREILAGEVWERLRVGFGEQREIAESGGFPEGFELGAIGG
jgi:hypothetical protein